MEAQMQKAESFKALHTSSRGFIMPNAWDVGSALILAEEGFKAIATTSGGIAFSLGKPDYFNMEPRIAVTREEMFDRIRQITSVVDIPVNGDLQDGYGDSPEAVAESIRLAIEAGLSGGNIEDKIPCAPGLHAESLAVERIAAARETINAAGVAFVLTARTDVLQVSPEDLETCIRRANLFRKAGADCLFTPGVSDLETIKILVSEINGPLNVVMGLGNARGNAHELLAAGVQRISLGASIARSALGFIRKAAREVFGHGSLGFAADQISQSELDALFTGARKG